MKEKKQNKKIVEGEGDVNPLFLKLNVDNQFVGVEEKIYETADYLQIDGVIAREGVFNFPDLGRVYRPAHVLKKAALLRREIPLLIDHPPAGVVETTHLVKGKADIYWDESKRVVKGSNVFFKRDPLSKRRITPQQLIDEIKTGKRRDLSIGYYHTLRKMKGRFGGEDYDYVETDLWLDHVALVEKGRCSYPSCGLGLDEREEAVGVEEAVLKGGDPFAGYKNFNECVKDQLRKGKNEESAKRICGFLEKRHREAHKNDGERKEEKRKVNMEDGDVEIEEYPNGEAELAVDERWTRAYINDLPDSAFAWIEPGGKKDSEGKTVPRSLRHFPYKDKNGKVDLPHVRNALARLGQGKVPQLKGSTRQRVINMLKRILAKASKKAGDAYQELKDLCPLELVDYHRKLHVEGLEETETHKIVVDLLKQKVNRK